MSYKISEAMSILGMGRDQLFYWIKTKKLIKPEVEGKGRGARSTLSKKNIFELAVIKELSSLGIELNFIEEILDTNQYEGSAILDIDFASGSGLLDRVYDSYYRQIEGADFFLKIFKDKNDKYKLGFIEHQGIKELNEEVKIISTIVVNLSEILRSLDDKINAL